MVKGTNSMYVIKSLLVLMIGISLTACVSPSTSSPERATAQEVTAQDLSPEATCVPSNRCAANECWCDCGTLCDTVQPFCADPVVFEGSTTAADHCFDACANRC
jgi:hypothetical protein